ncbi:GtrA family protein [Sphingobium sp. CR2-8]|uniref:GtrA family protein n=1 Tax=Sphingobium sp. CR2-8 TaxID=1306534 RepID=UPI002DB86EAB|nr:GtrA family protein [Sphingobium sp. CR2-8]MEC3910805.1 GtrA family protein [Sphingobium sp. CR2-8]
MRALILSSTWLAFTRFAISGGLAACVAIIVYAACAMMMGLHPQVANLLAYIAQLGVSYRLHRSFSFADAQSGAGSIARYCALSLGAFACNSLWVWICTRGLHWQPWTALLPMIFATPLVTFLLARHWVFAKRNGRN